MHYVLVDSRHSLRFLVLDSEHRASFNSSSVVTNVEASDPLMANISIFQTERQLRGEEEIYPVSSGIYRDDAISGVYDKRSV